MLDAQGTAEFRNRLTDLLDQAESNLLTVTTDPVVAVAHAWFVRTIGTIRSVLLLEDARLGECAAPLIRSALEHAVAIAWVDKGGTDALISLARGQRKWATDVQRAVAAADAHESREGRTGWPEALRNLLSEIVASDLPKSSLDGQLHHLQRFTAVEAFDLFVAWLSETGYSHATDASAQPYVRQQEQRFLLLSNSRRPQDTVVLRCGLIAVVACAAMQEILKSDIWAAQLAAADSALSAVLERGRRAGWAGEPRSQDWRTRFDP